jgi:hypothetical protein
LGGEAGGNDYIHIVESTFSGNSAAAFGGAISSYRVNRYVTIAGCSIIKNTATLSGKRTCLFILD